MIIDTIKTWIFTHQYLLIKHAMNIVIALLMLLLGLFFSKWIKKIIINIMISNNIDKTIREFLSVIIYYSIITITLITVFNQLGLKTTSIITLLGAAGLAIGLALQNSLSNFAAGILLVFFRPLRTGESVIIGKTKGVVEHVQFFFTTLRASNNDIIIIPNNRIINDSIINKTRYQNKCIQIKISVSYNTNIEFVKNIIKEIILLDNRIQHDKNITIRLHEMASSSLNFIIKVWTTNDNAKNVYWDLLENIKKQLDYHKISIPFDQMDVHLYNHNQ